MKTITLANVIFLILSVFCSYNLHSQIDSKSFFDDYPSSELFILGTFHFKDAGLDGYKPQHHIDIKSDKRQKELKEILDIIEKFKPTKIAVEAKKYNQRIIDSLYQAYLAGEYELKSNEIFQVGFRMGKILGHDKIYAVDVMPAEHLSYLSKEERKSKKEYFIAKANASQLERAEGIHEAYMSMYAEEDRSKKEMTLLDYFRHKNSKDRVNLGHGHYIMGDFQMIEGDDYFGPDNSNWWYNRNARIFGNLLNIHTPGEDRVFFLVGAGHLPFLRFLADASPDYNLVTLEDMLAKY